MSAPAYPCHMGDQDDDPRRDALLHELLKTPPQPRKERDRDKPKTPSVQRVESPSHGPISRL